MKKMFKSFHRVVIMAVVLLVLSLSLVTAVPAGAADPPLYGYEIITSPPMAFSDGGWGGWSVPAGKVVLGGGFYSTGPVAASAPGTPFSVWPHYTYGANEYGWCVRDAIDSTPNTITIYAICAYKPDGYEVITSNPLNYGDTGWGGWSVPAGKVVLGGGFVLSDPWSTPAGAAAASAPGTPNSAWPHYTYGPNEYGWCVRDAHDSQGNPNSHVYAICAYRPAGYEVITSNTLHYGDTGWAGWSAPAGKVVTGGGFNLGGCYPAAVSVPGTPNSVWPHYTYGPYEYGWCVQDAHDSQGNPNSYVYVICAEVAPPPPPTPPSKHGAAVGIEVYPVDKVGLIAPWIALAVVIIAGGVVLLIRRRAHS